MKRKTVLAGDIGGTHARLATVEWTEEGRPRIVARREYVSAEIEGLEPIVRDFLGRLDGAPPTHACLAVPCPIVGDACRPANLPWSIRIAGFDRAIGIPGARLINDFDAVGHAIRHLAPDDVAPIRDGEPDPDAPVAVLGAGTGLGVVFVLPEPDRTVRVVPSEGGHVGFAARGALEHELGAFLAGRRRAESDGHVSYERVLSGDGLCDVYRFLIDSGREPERSDTRVAMETRDPAAVISERALAGTDVACERALDIFVSVYGTLAGDLALLVQARGGVYLGGGIAPRILPALRAGGFERAFLAKGRFRRFIAPIPVWAITNPDAGILGAAAVAAGSIAARRVG
ncbi:MAG: glucokinase [Gemmatimonadota bacterium]